jgi:hypothetical protein
MDCVVLGNTGGYFSGCEPNLVKITIFLSICIFLLYKLLTWTRTPSAS